MANLGGSQFKGRRFRFERADNFKLDRIRSEDKKKNVRVKVTAWLLFVACALILIAAAFIPKIADFVIERSRNDAFKYAKDTAQLIRKAEMDNGALINDYTVFLVEHQNKYYFFWYHSEASDESAKLVEIDDPGSFAPPINVKAGNEVAYPFHESPINMKDGKAILSDDFELLSGFDLVPYTENEELNQDKRRDVSLYVLQPRG